MKRILLLIPEGLTFDILTEAQQNTINRVFGQYIMPMPSTIVVDGFQICDALTIDSFNPDNMAQYGIDWTIIGMWNDIGETLISLDETELLKRLSDKVNYDEEGNELSRERPSLYEPHRWSGWPKII